MHAVRWDPRLLEEVLPWRHPYGPPVPRSKARPFDFARLHEAVRKQSAWTREWTTEGGSPEATRIVERWRARVAEPAPPAFDPAFEGHALFLYGAHLREARDVPLGPLVRHWCDTVGVLAALDALSVAMQDRPSAAYPRHLVLAGEPTSDPLQPGIADPSGWEALRRALVHAPEAEYAAARERAHVLAASVTGIPNHTIGLAVAFPDDVELAEAAVPARFDIRNWNHLLSTTGLPLDAAAYHLPTFAKEAKLAMLWRWGTDALPALIARFDDGPRDARLLAQFDDPAAGELLVARLEQKNVRPYAVAWLEANPALAVPMLTPLANPRTKQGQAVLAVLEAIERRGEATPPPPPPSTAVPALLLDPPWRTKPTQRPAVPRVPGLPTPEGPVRAAPIVGTPTDFGPPGITTPAAALEALAQAERGEGRVEPWHIDALDDARALAALTYLTPGFLTQDLRAAIARFGVDALAFVRKHTMVPSAGVTVGVTALHAPFLARNMVHALTDRYYAADVAHWFGADPEIAIRGLLPIALGDDELRDRALAVLRHLADLGHADLVRTSAAEQGREAALAIDDLLGSDALWFGLPPKPPKLPEWWDPAALPPVHLRDGTPLTTENTRALCEMLWFFDPNVPYAGAAIVREACRPEDLAAFTRASASAWLAHGRVQHIAVFGSLAVFWDEETVRWISDNLDHWSRTATNETDRHALDVLGEIGTDAALTFLGRVARRGRHTYLRERAERVLRREAARRGLSAEALEDRTAPDLGLDESGTLSLDFGPRAFRVGFDEVLRPFVIDTTGGHLPTLPRREPGDDPAKVKEATARFTTLVADAERVAQQQSWRFEAALMASRRWSARDFRRFLVEHPLVGHLVRRFVWARFDGVVTPFRVAEDRSYADANDDAVALDDDALVGLVHPLHLDADTIDRWRALLGDYGIVQPFEQLERRVYRVDPSERAGAVCRRFEGRTAKRPWLYVLRSRGWTFLGRPPEGHHTLQRVFPGGLVATVPFTPAIAAAEGEDHTLGPVTLAGGTFAALGEVASSELLLDLDRVVVRVARS